MKDKTNMTLFERVEKAEMELVKLKADMEDADRQIRNQLRYAYTLQAERESIRHASRAKVHHYSCEICQDHTLGDVHCCDKGIELYGQANTAFRRFQDMQDGEERNRETVTGERASSWGQRSKKGLTSVTTARRGRGAVRTESV